MKVAIVQTKLAFGDVEANYSLMEEKILAAVKNKPDTIVLPEMWNTSFFPRNISALADENGERTKAFLATLANKFDVNIVGGSVATLRNDKLFNTAYVFSRQGKLVASYDKVHLFSPTSEDKVFDSGKKMGLFELDGVKCGLAICYDLRFVEWIRQYALKDISILFLPAAWPIKRTMHWDVLNRARAIENQMFVVCCNSIGVSDTLTFGGNSAIIDPWGEYIVEPDGQDDIKFGVINLAAINKIRQKMNVFSDRKKNLYDM